ncbi:restriction endonuclease subunit S [Geobacter sp. AOG1]|uniref:restriction endonuclease subunit S n=1 Tax=Geobacter sp. AOG1 TaxID=1566346 RepID=UPI001CC4DE51|nr:restriction endonuclease subunit S [Geobacter sp. AOG1]GFE56736.1 hypothetical protein AOG1_06150 [Geobacter sp. AOG1]
MSIDEAQKLPAEWRWATVGAVCTSLDYGYTASADFAVSEPKFLRITDIQDGSVRWDSVPGCKITEPDEEANRLHDGDIVFARTGGTTGKSYLIRKPPRAVFASYLIRLRPNVLVTSDFLYMFFQSDLYWAQVWANARGGAQPNVNATILGSLSLPLPPLPEQKRIAAILTEKMVSVEKAQAAAEARLKAAKELPAAYLREVFESEEAKGWPVKKIGAFAKVQSGYAFKSEWFAKSGIRLLRNANVFQGYLDWKDVVHLPEDRLHEFPSYEMFEGDIVLSLDRPWVSNGLKVARLTDKDLPCLLLQRVGRFSINDGLDPDYLFIFVNSPGFIDEITGHDQSLGVPHVSPKQIEAIDIPVPPTARQQEIAQELRLKKVTTVSITKMLEDELTAISRMPAILLRQAFQGEL